MTIFSVVIVSAFLFSQQEEKKSVVELLHSRHIGIPDDRAKVENELIGRGKEVVFVFREQFNFPEDSLRIEMTKRKLIIWIVR